LSEEERRIILKTCPRALMRGYSGTKEKKLTKRGGERVEESEKKKL